MHEEHWQRSRAVHATAFDLDFGRHRMDDPTPGLDSTAADEQLTCVANEACSCSLQSGASRALRVHCPQRASL